MYVRPEDGTRMEIDLRMEVAILILNLYGFRDFFFLSITNGWEAIQNWS